MFRQKLGPTAFGKSHWEGEAPAEPSSGHTGQRLGRSLDGYPHTWQFPMIPLSYVK
jgi:hypothetical protein